MTDLLNLTPEPCKACNRGIKRGKIYTTPKGTQSLPIIKEVEGLHYARCSNTNCTKYDLYEFLGRDPLHALKVWNDAMISWKDNRLVRDRKKESK